MTRLLVFPGLSSPHHEKYRPVYDLIRSGVKTRRMSDPLIITYPGQVLEDGSPNGLFSHERSLAHARHILHELIEKGDPFKTLAISYGCNVSLTLAEEMGTSPAWEHATIWGPFSYARTWEYFAKAQDWNTSMKGTSPEGSPGAFFASIVPNEYLLPRAPLPVSVGVGVDDPYVSIEELRCLQGYCTRADVPRRTFVMVDGCRHNVSPRDPGWSAYLDFALS